MEEAKMDCNCCCNREMTIIEEIDALPIEERIKEKIIEKLNVLVSTNEALIKEIRDANSEIHSLSRAVLYLSKEVGKCKEDK